MTSGGIGCCVDPYEAPITAFLLGPSFHPGGLDATRRLARAALVGPRTRVLDVACGRGTSAWCLAETFGARVVGVDASAASVDAAAREGAVAGGVPRPEFRVGRADALPAADGAFDVVLCECALSTFPDAATALTEFHRVLVPGGRLAVSDVTVRGVLPPELAGPLAPALCIAGALDEGGYERAIAGAGFGPVRTYDETPALASMLDDLEMRLAALAHLTDAGLVAPSFDVDAARSALAAARRSVDDGRLGYAALVTRRATSSPAPARATPPSTSTPPK